MISLRPYLKECLGAIREAYVRGGVRRQLVSLPTGTGKTVIFAQGLGFSNEGLGFSNEL